MKNKDVFFNPFRLISPKLDAEASRLEEHYESHPEGVTCLEEGLLLMVGKLIEMVGILRKALVMADSEKLDRCAGLAREIHDEEKALTRDLVSGPGEGATDLLKAVVAFPGKLERVGDLMESILNVCRIKDREGVVFSDRAHAELEELFDLFSSQLVNFRDALLTNNLTLLQEIEEQARRIGTMVVDFSLAHEARLVEGLCSPKASSLFLDVLDSVRTASRHLREMAANLTNTHHSRQDAAAV